MAYPDAPLPGSRWLRPGSRGCRSLAGDKRARLATRCKESIGMAARLPGVRLTPGPPRNTPLEPKPVEWGVITSPATRVGGGAACGAASALLQLEHDPCRDVSRLDVCD